MEDAVLCGLFTLFAALTKSEGLPLAAINFLLILVFAIRRREWKHLVGFILVLGIGLGIWLIFRAQLPHTDENYLSRLSIASLSQGVQHMGSILEALFSAFMDHRNWGILWMILPILGVIGFRSFSKPTTICLWVLLVSHLALYAMVYMITPWNLGELLPVTIPRLLLHVSPTAMLLVAAHAGEILRVAPPPAKSV